MQQDLIFDIGMNKGEDTNFYLQKGFRVVALEANPQLVSHCKARFAAELADKRLVIIESGIWNEEKTLTFYENLSNDHWSSFEPEWGCRGGQFRTYDVKCTTIAQILSQYDTPYYMKIDVEGADELVVRDLLPLNNRPAFVSVEAYGTKAFSDFSNLGYKHFKIVRQSKKAPPPFPPLEGSFVEANFTVYDSGLFGRELPNEWIDQAEAKRLYDGHISPGATPESKPELEWYDIHVKL